MKNYKLVLLAASVAALIGGNLAAKDFVSYDPTRLSPSLYLLNPLTG